MNNFKIAAKVLVFTIFFIGIFYQIVVTCLGNIFFWHESHGSLIKENNKVIGSELIGQAFTTKKYFSGRLPDILNGIGTLDAHPSNFSIKSYQFLNRTNELKEFSLKLFNNPEVPIEFLTGSGSGLDPHISVNTAYYQIDSVAEARGVSSARIKILVDNLIEYPQFFILGQERINLLKLNLSLDQQFGKKK